MSMYLSLGAVEISAFLSFATMGFVSAKAYEYYVNYPHDRLAFKLSVAFCTLLSVLDTAFVGEALNFEDVVICSLDLCSGFSTLNTQCFFAWRLRKISGDYILPGIITALSVLQCDLDGVFPIGYIWLGGSILGDLLITAGMGYHLLFKTRKSSLANSRMTFKKIVFRTLECNVLALVCQTGDLILFKTPSGFLRETFTSQGEPIELDPVSVHFDRTVRPSQRPHAGSLSKEDFV
ncbi:hypothetical protein MNV49_002010 [Pseudohyphozyma bogoriensis]|nr:hypothetical protein MNV49_002010 [Pseudohyphozyma bogoriensis]